jgi:glycosyltransferase involved in cell wall biosynthesis
MPGVPQGPGFIFSKRQVVALRELGVPVATFFLPSRQSLPVLLRAWRQFRREVRTFRPDVVHAHFGTMIAFFCAVSTRRPLVVTYRGSDLNPVPSISRLRSVTGKLLSHIAAARAARIICVSPQLKARLRWGKDRATVIPNGVETRDFFPRPRDGARAELGWGVEERVVLFNGGMFPHKKRVDLAQAGVDVAESLCGRIRFHVLDGQTSSSLVPTFMNAADCLVVTSDWEGSPDIVKEALACNLPIVSVDVGDVRERLEGVHPSRIVEREPAAIGRALAEILAQRERSNGQQAIQELTMRRVATRVLLELQAAAATRAPDAADA